MTVTDPICPCSFTLPINNHHLTTTWILEYKQNQYNLPKKHRQGRKPTEHGNGSVAICLGNCSSLGTPGKVKTGGLCSPSEPIFLASWSFRVLGKHGKNGIKVKSLDLTSTWVEDDWAPTPQWLRMLLPKPSSKTAPQSTSFCSGHTRSPSLLAADGRVTKSKCQTGFSGTPLVESSV